MNTYKFEYVVTEERMALIRAESEEDAKNKLDEILIRNNTDLAIWEIEKYGKKLVNQSGLGINYKSISKIDKSDYGMIEDEYDPETD